MKRFLVNMFQILAGTVIGMVMVVGIVGWFFIIQAIPTGPDKIEQQNQTGKYLCLHSPDKCIYS